jgi:hypothetical protein
MHWARRAAAPILQLARMSFVADSGERASRPASLNVSWSFFPERTSPHPGTGNTGMGLVRILPPMKHIGEYEMRLRFGRLKGERSVLCSATINQASRSHRREADARRQSSGYNARTLPTVSGGSSGRYRFNP